MPSVPRLFLLSCLAFALGLSSFQAPLRADSSLPDYGECLDGFAGAMVKPLQDAQTAVGKHRLGVAIVALRELGSGKRSPLCLRLESDLSAKLRSWTIFKPASSTKTAEALASLDGDPTDLSQPETLKKLGTLLKANVVVTGTYEIEGSSVQLTLHLLRCADGQELWTESSAFPSAQVGSDEIVLIDGSQPLSYVRAVPAAPAAPLSPTAGALADTATASALSPSAAASPELSPDLAAQASRWHERSSLYDESAFSWTRINVGLGYKAFLPQNPTFASVAGNLRGPYIDFSWADVFNAEVDIWSQRSSVLADVGSLFAYGVSLSANLPWRPGPHSVLYGGIGTRLESITVSSYKVPADDAVIFGNNSFFVDAGYKLHWGPYGAETAVNYDLYATDSAYLTVKFGLYYEFNLQ
jgi:hypothetical protein